MNFESVKCSSCGKIFASYTDLWIHKESEIKKGFIKKRLKN